MLGYFPDAYPDELFYSICARFAEAMHYGSYVRIIKELFGNVHPVTIEFPIGLDYLVTSLPSGHCYTADHFIDEHTLLPFYGPFLPSERLLELREAMHGNNAHVIVMHFGYAHCLVRPLRYLRLCPQCVIEDRTCFDEAYWHRVHQIPGVLVCPLHGELLEETCIASLSWNRERYKFYSAEEALHLQPLTGLHAQSPWQQILLAIARDAAWLLKQRNLAPGYQILLQNYQQVFIEQGLASPTGRRHLKTLLALFRKKFPDALLQELQCQLESDHPGRLESLFHGLWTWQHPLYHLLLIQLLDLTAEAFFRVPVSSPPFGEGPWPCLNKASDHYQQNLIEDCQIRRSYTYKDRLVGTFACSCGFVYWRHGPDHGPDDQFRRDGIKAVGPIWEAKLHQLWEEGTLTQEGIAQQLGISRGQLREHAMKRGLIPYPSGRLKVPIVETLPSQREEQEASLRNQYRAVWLAALETGVNIWGTYQKTLRKAYRWLSKYDWQWLHEHMPPRKPRTPSARRMSQDAQWSKQVRAAAVQLKNNAQRPIRVSRALIGREIGQGKLASGWWDKERYPLTAEALDEVIETLEAVRVRRVWWAANCYEQERICPKRWQLLERAGLSKTALASHEVATALETALRMLTACFGVNTEGVEQEPADDRGNGRKGAVLVGAACQVERPQ